MSRAVNRKRRYDSPLRREQAEATRLAILDAAQRLFERDGYAATTIGAIAKEAGVAVKTVYVAFENKSGLLRALWNARLRGGQEDVPMAQQEMYREVLDEPDPRRKLELNARNSRIGKLRIGALSQVIREAAPLEDEIGELWARINGEYHANQRAVIETIVPRALKKGMDVDQGTDILWTLNHPNTWQLLVVDRGWTPEAYEAWAAETAIAQLLKDGLPGRKRS
jgi:AcrR family transcriptional regulator